MATTSISVARLLQLRVPVAWQEAVEVARLAGLASEQRLARITLDRCLISIDGSVELAATGSGDPLSVMQLLAALLDGQSAPPELVTLVMLGDEAPSGFTTPTQEKPKGLSLEWFVRPNPEVEVARLAGRALAAAAAADGAASIAQLRAHVTEQAATRPDEKKVDASARTRPWLRGVLVAAGLAVAVSAAALAWARWEKAIVGFFSVTPVVITADEAGGDASSPLPARATTVSPAARSAVRVDPSRSAPATASSASPVAPPLESDAEPPRISDGSSSAPAAPPLAIIESGPGSVPATADARDDARVYSEHDSGVAPPTMTYPKLPSTPRPDTLPSDAYIEVTVDEQGLVQQVRLRSVDPTVNERMIIAAAKAWQFEPARKDGVPVKYVLRVPVGR